MELIGLKQIDNKILILKCCELKEICFQRKYQRGYHKVLNMYSLPNGCYDKFSMLPNSTLNSNQIFCLYLVTNILSRDINISNLSSHEC